MDKTNYCDFSDSSSLTIDIISTTFPIVSVVTCALALVLIAYYKLHHSFNYRLVLYLLVAHLMNSITDTLQISFLWLKGDIGIVLPDLCVAVAYMKVYCSLSVVFSTTAVMVEILSITMCYNQQRTRENILIFLCFFLPHLDGIIVFATGYYGSNKSYTCGIKLAVDNCQTTLLVRYMYSECISIYMVAFVAIALFYLIYDYMYVRLKQTCTDWEEQHLSNQHITAKDAPKETLPFVVYPTISLATLLIYYLHFLQQDVGTLDYVTALIGGSAGAICSGAFIIHLCTMGAKKRNAMKCSQQAYKSLASKTEGHTRDINGSI